MKKIKTNIVVSTRKEVHPYKDVKSWQRALVTKYNKTHNRHMFCCGYVEATHTLYIAPKPVRITSAILVELKNKVSAMSCYQAVLFMCDHNQNVIDQDKVDSIAMFPNSWIRNASKHLDGGPACWQALLNFMLSKTKE